MGDDDVHRWMDERIDVCFFASGKGVSEMGVAFRGRLRAVHAVVLDGSEEHEASSVLLQRSTLQWRF